MSGGSVGAVESHKSKPAIEYNLFTGVIERESVKYFIDSTTVVEPGENSIKEMKYEINRFAE